ncbi:MAG: alpha-1,2-fucosyltransferase [Bacteroidota bacterium]|nr:alpha-1,2-fucosyltransferase [Bacteroidota bacterium]
MNVIVIFNGLGNQMSQYAFYLKKKSINKSTYIINLCYSHNGFELNKVFPINYEETNKQKILLIIFKILLTKQHPFILKPLKYILNSIGCKIIQENFDYSFKTINLKPTKGITFYFGGWHSEKYFISIRNLIKNEFKFKNPLDETNNNILKKINSTNSISLHVRRGDYLSLENIKLFGNVCDKPYFEKAIALMETRIESPHFFVFSNDIPWTMSNLTIKNATYVTSNQGENSWKDMYLISSCKHNIISNSTFSWWGAWLNKNPNKIVVSPDKFLQSDMSTDIYPQSWIRLSNNKE